jgi:O-antigen/teichoic acid export membrane protein
LFLIDRETFHLVWRYSFDAFLILIAGRICVQSPVILIGLFLAPAQITWFAIASRLVEFARALLRSATTTLTPAISSLHVRGEIETIQKIYLNATRWSYYLIGPIQLGLIIYGGSFLTIWMKSTQYRQWCYPSLLILVSTLSISTAQSVSARILYGTNQLKWFARIALAESALNLSLGLILINLYDIEGVSIAVAVPNLLSSILIIRLAGHYLKISWISYFRQTALKPMVANAVLLTYWIFFDHTIQNWLDLSIDLASGVILYSLAVIYLETKFNLVFAQWINKNLIIRIGKLMRLRFSQKP